MIPEIVRGISRKKIRRQNQSDNRRILLKYSVFNDILYKRAFLQGNDFELSYRTKRIIITFAPPAAAAVLFALRRYIFFIANHMHQCLFYRITGFLCPGCGNTRAVKELLSLHFLTAIRYNATIPALLIAALFFYTQYVISAWIKPVKPIRPNSAFYISAGTMFAIYCVARNIINFMP